MSCEVRVAGRIGPLTTAALPHGAVIESRPATTLLTIVRSEPTVIADLMRRLEPLDAEIIAIRCRTIEP